MEQNTKTSEIMEMIAISKKITQKEIEDFLNESKYILLTLENIKFSKIEFYDLDDLTMNVKIFYTADAITFTQLELLKGQTFPKHKDQIIRIQFINSRDGNIQIHTPIDNEIIPYDMEYDKILIDQYDRKIGSDGLIFNNKEVINKQRSVAGYLIKNIGLNIIKGKSIMNISLPINIFDTRSILELFAWQNAYAAIYLEKGGATFGQLEKIKYSTVFAVSKFHLSGAQLKPFNPILGETFQCKILDSHFYMEQTSHHPPILNFYAFGKNYKIYGYNEMEASTGANSVKVVYKGCMNVEYSDGSKHLIIYPNMKIGGSMVGDRMLKFRGRLFVIDQTNDLISMIHLDPDERGFFKKMVSKKTTYPDYFKGVITTISKNAKYDKKEKSWSILDTTKHLLCSIEGEFTNHMKFDEDVYWSYEKDSFPLLRRMSFTLPSDSTFREDIIWLKKKDEDAAQRLKVKLEEIQRKDKKCREKHCKK